MNVYFNNVSVHTSANQLSDLIEEQGLTDKQGIAVAVNQNIIPKSEWTTVTLSENDNILVITATQGG